MLKFFLLFFVSVVLFSCEEKANSSLTKNNAEKEPPKLIREIAPDTAGCSWYFKDRHVRDTLINESAVIVKVSDTLSNISSGALLTTKKYRDRYRLWACSIPTFIKLNDTILISGYVYWTYSFEQPPGYPTFITKIVY